MDFPTLTVIVPVYNEARTIVPLLEAVGASPYEKQIIVVDDGSDDGTAEALGEVRRRYRGEIYIIRHPTNLGKGAAIRTALGAVRGKVVIVQDADLEYDPSDYPRLVEPILSGRACVVYGSRYMGRETVWPRTANLACVYLLNAMVLGLFGRRISDEATGYKAFSSDLLRRLDLRCQRFEFCPEVTAKLCRLGIAIVEVPVRYRPRSARDGKKIRWWDGVEAIATLIRWRLAPWPAPPSPGHRRRWRGATATPWRSGAQSRFEREPPEPRPPAPRTS